MKAGIEDRLIAKYVTGSMTDDERIEIEEWASESDANRKFLEDVSDIRRDIDMLSAMSRIDSRMAWKKVSGKSWNKSSFRNLLSLWKNVAAVIVLPLLAVSLYAFMKNSESVPADRWNEVISPYGLVSTVVLPDSTVVHLNSKSRLRYPSEFKGKERLVELEGEAYFDVAASREYPFIVACSSVAVRATGTEFNVFEHENGDVAVSLCDGHVELMRIIDEGRSVIGILSPGQTAFYDKAGNKISLSDQNIEKYTGWKDGMIVFAEDSLGDVLGRLARTYDVHFDLDADIDDSYLYTGTFESPSLDRILRYIEMTTPVTFVRETSGTDMVIEVHGRE